MLGRPKGKTYSRLMHFYISDDEFNTLKEYANKNAISMSQAIRNLIKKLKQEVQYEGNNQERS